MPSEVAILQFIDCEGPGYFGRWLDDKSLPRRVTRVDQGEEVPPRIDDTRALVLLGGPMSVNDNLPWIPRALELVAEAHRLRVPVLGHCLGAQLVAKALGGTVGRNPVKEIGWLPVSTVTAEGAVSWCQALPERFEAFHWHGETFSIPAGAMRLFASDACAHQGFVIGNTLALQFHVEIDAQMVGAWARAYSEEISEPSATVQSEAEMTRDLGLRVEACNRVADLIYERWLGEGS